MQFARHCGSYKDKSAMDCALKHSTTVFLKKQHILKDGRRAVYQNHCNVR